jgi:hypothetical protein
VKKTRSRAADLRCRALVNDRLFYLVNFETVVGRDLAGRLSRVNAIDDRSSRNAPAAYDRSAEANHRIDRDVFRAAVEIEANERVETAG